MTAENLEYRRIGKLKVHSKRPDTVERVKGIEPSYAAWEAAVLPLNYTRIATNSTSETRARTTGGFYHWTIADAPAASRNR
jgi:hypothetical protein